MTVKRLIVIPFVLLAAVLRGEAASQSLHLAKNPIGVFDSGIGSFRTTGS